MGASGTEDRKGLLAPLPNVVVIKMRAPRQFEGDPAGLLNAIVAAATDGAAPALQEVMEKSKYLNGYHYFVITNPREVNAYQIRQRLLGSDARIVADVQFETMPLIRDWCVIPNDPLFAQQWNMTQIKGPQAWDISTGANTVVVAILDSGTDLTHPDLQLAGPGIDLGDMISDGSPNNFGPNTGHGTCCSGIAAAIFNNAAGVAGVAGACRILPLAIRTFSNVEIANGVNWAVAQGADSISMSFGMPQSLLIDTALANAFAANVVLCAATGNNNAGNIAYPARHPNVMAIGASDQVDRRKSPTSPDLEPWGSNFGVEISVVAPGVRIPTTDIQGSGGYNTATTPLGGDYYLTFNGTSSATPHVAGLAALIRSRYPALTNVQIRDIIERCADKVGEGIVYAVTPGHPNGTWNREMGYGRINAFCALKAAPTCEEICQAQNDYLTALCAKKVNLLSCRCSGCDTDDKYPVIGAPSDAPFLNTAYDGAGGFIPSGGGKDAHWEVALGGPSGPSSVSTPWIQAFVFHNTAWVLGPSNANWISYYANSAQSGNNEDAYFRYKFNLSSSVDPSTFALMMDFYADNRVWEIYVNGCVQSTRPNGQGVLPQFPNQPQTSYQTDGFTAGNEVHITLDNCWRQCDNEIIVHVMSGPGFLGFLARNAVEVEPDETGCDCHCDCVDVKLPDIKPRICVTWGDSKCDCLETDDVEVLCVTVCNCYSNVTFSNLTICQIQVTDMAGNPVATLPDGTPSVQVIPSGPICFGDIGPCTDRNHPACVSREIVLRTRGAVGKNYRLTFKGICFDVCHHLQSEQCFTMKLCQD